MKSLQGLFNWSMQFQGGEEREKPAGISHEEYDAQKMKWLAAALETYSQVQDPAARMRQIKMALDMSNAGGSSHAGTQGSTQAAETKPTAAQSISLHLSLEDKEALLEELADWVASIDNARDLHTIGGLPTLLALLDSSTVPSLRWRAAEVAATCMANNPIVQKEFLDGGMMPKVLGLLDTKPDGLAQQQHQQQQQHKQQQQQQEEEQGSGEGQAPEHEAECEPQSDDELCTLLHAKGLLAMSALVRQYHPALNLFRLEGGLLRLIGLASAPDSRVQKKALTLLAYVLSQNPRDVGPAIQFGLLEPCARHVQAAIEIIRKATESSSMQGLENEDEKMEVACAALGVLAEAVKTTEGWQGLRSSPPGARDQVGGLEDLLHQFLKHSRARGDIAEHLQPQSSLAYHVTKALAGPMPPPAAAVAVDPDHVDASRDHKPEGPVSCLTTVEGQKQDAAASAGAVGIDSGSSMGLSVVPDNRF